MGARRKKGGNHLALRQINQVPLRGGEPFPGEEPGRVSAVEEKNRRGQSELEQIVVE